MMGAPVVTSAWLAGQIDGTRAQDVRSGLERLIKSGALRPGTQLPTIRQLAGDLDTKVSAVTDAWSMLRRDGLLETRRRGGTRVVGVDAAAAEFPGWSAIELVHALPDVALLPDVAPVFADAVDPAHPFGRFTTLTPNLGVALEDTWAFPADAFTTFTGGRAAMAHVFEAAADGGAVAVEMPGLLRTTDALQHLGLETLAVDSDAEGPRPESVRAALDAGARVLGFQPRRSIPTGSTLSVERRDALAGVLEGRDVWVVEEDPNGPLFDGASLGSVLPERTVRVTQYWRAFGPDVDLVAVGGAARLVQAVRDRQQASGVRAGVLQQEVVARLLRDPVSADRAAQAGRRYDQRHQVFANALARRGVRAQSHGGVVAWVPVDDESNAVSSLASLGIRVLAGRTSDLRPGATSHIRLATTRMPEDAHLDELAAAVAAAARDRSLADTE